MKERVYISVKSDLNVPEGYAVRKRDSGYAYRYCLKDHLGNNRVVMEINKVNSHVNQSVDYYPFGMPYAYCLNNPVRYVDLNGKDPGDIFKTPRDAAKDWGNYYNGASILRKREFGSTIYIVKNNSGELVGYSYSVANEGKGDGHVNPSLPPNFEKEVADIHSHENYQGYDVNKFSSADKKDNDWRKNIGYVTTPNGSLLEYNSSTKKIEVVSTDMPSDPQDPNRKNKIDPIDVPSEKQTAVSRAEQEKKPELRIPELQKDKISWAF
jgi:hypothetical protein